MPSDQPAAYSRLVSMRRLGWHYAAIQGIYWAVIASNAAYVVVLLQSRGITNTEIGVIMAGKALASIVMQPLAASLADRLQHRLPLKYIGMLLTLVAMAANTLLIFSGGSFALAVAVFMLLGASENVLAPINDSLAIQYINGGYPLNYSVARGIGSLVFAFACLGQAGLVRLAGVESTLLLHGLLLIVFFVVLLTYRTYPGPAPGEHERARPGKAGRSTYRQILAANPAIIIFLAAAFCFYMGSSAMFQYLPNIFTRTGGSSANIGLALFVLAAVQFPTSLFYARIARRVSTAALLLVSYAFVLLRWLLIFLFGDPITIIAFMAIDIFGGGLQIQAEVYFINELVGPADLVKGQSLTKIVPGGIGVMLSSLLAGYLIDAISINGMMVVSLALMLAGVLILLTATVVRRRRRNGVRELSGSGPEVI